MHKMVCDICTHFVLSYDIIRKVIIKKNGNMKGATFMHLNESEQVNYPDYQAKLPVSEPSISKWLLLIFLSSIPIAGFILHGHIIVMRAVTRMTGT